MNRNVETEIRYHSYVILDNWLYKELGQLYPKAKEAPLIPAINLYFKHYYPEIEEKHCNASYNEKYQPFLSPDTNNATPKKSNLNYDN